MVEERGILYQAVFNAVADLELVIKIRLAWDIFHKSKGRGLCIADKLFRLLIVVEIFDTSILLSVFKHLDVVAFWQKEKPPFFGRGIEKGVILQDASVCARWDGCGYLPRRQGCCRKQEQG